jgi:hypothetical protein
MNDKNSISFETLNLFPANRREHANSLNIFPAKLKYYTVYGIGGLNNMEHGNAAGPIICITFLKTKSATLSIARLQPATQEEVAHTVVPGECNRMNTTTLDRLLRVRSEGPEDFPRIKAATRWSRAWKSLCNLSTSLLPPTPHPPIPQIPPTHPAISTHYQTCSCHGTYQL